MTPPNSPRPPSRFEPFETLVWTKVRNVSENYFEKSVTKMTKKRHANKLKAVH